MDEVRPVGWPFPKLPKGARYFKIVCICTLALVVISLWSVDAVTPACRVALTNGTLSLEANKVRDGITMWNAMEAAKKSPYLNFRPQIQIGRSAMLFWGRTPNFELNWEMSWGSNQAVTWVTFPLVVLLVPAAIPLIFMLIKEERRRRRKLAGLCEKCGYDLRVSEGRCPECGEPIERADAEAAQT